MTRVNVGTIGHIDHGRNTLTVALLTALANAAVAKGEVVVVETSTKRNTAPRDFEYPPDCYATPPAIPHMQRGGYEKPRGKRRSKKR